MAKATAAADAPDPVSQVLALLEWSAVGDGGSVRCPLCHQSPALDPANPREWEGHAPDCLMGAALAAKA